MHPQNRKAAEQIAFWWMQGFAFREDAMRKKLFWFIHMYQMYYVLQSFSTMSAIYAIRTLKI